MSIQWGKGLNVSNAKCYNFVQSEISPFGKEVKGSFSVFKMLSDWISVNVQFNTLPENKILHKSKLKELADNNINMTQKFKFILRSVENTVGKGKNAGNQHFLLFPHCFQKLSFSRSLKVRIVW